MFWDKKEKSKGLPDLPPVKFVPPARDASEEENEDADADAVGSEKHTLPSFPDSPIQRGFSQSAIKDAVASPEENAESPEQSVAQPPPQLSSMKAVEVDEWSPPAFSSPLPPPPVAAPPGAEMRVPMRREIPALEMPSVAVASSPLPSRASKNTDIFVKLEKFYSAKKALAATAAKLDEMESLLHKIRETKMREEQELASWEKELATIKARMKDVTETIFEKVE